MKEKIIISGHIIEIFGYSRLHTDTQDMDKIRQGTGKDNALNYARRQQYRRDMIRRLATSNFNMKYAKFITLTFSKNETDLHAANKKYKQFIQKLRRRYGMFKYITVIEFQERGSIHYHMLSDLPFIPYTIINTLWGNGNIDIRAVDKVDNLGAYLVKYMNKDNDDIRLKGEKAYLISNNLIKPSVITNWKDGNETIKAILQFYRLDKKTPTYERTYESEYTGTTRYLQYNLSRKEQ